MGNGFMKPSGVRMSAHAERRELNIKSSVRPGSRSVAIGPEKRWVCWRRKAGMSPGRQRPQGKFRLGGCHSWSGWITSRGPAKKGSTNGDRRSRTARTAELVFLRHTKNPKHRSPH